MNVHCLTNEQILAFSTALFRAERSQATVEKYLRSVRAFFLYQKDRPVTKVICRGVRRLGDFTNRKRVFRAIHKISSEA